MGFEIVELRQTSGAIIKNSGPQNGKSAVKNEIINKKVRDLL